MKLVEICREQMEEWDKQTSLLYLEELRALIEAGEIAGWCYVAVNATTVYNAGGGIDNDPYRIIGVLEQTKQSILNDLIFGDEDEE